MALLDGKRLLITGVITDASLAFGVAKVALEQGADVVLTGAGRGMSLTERTAKKLPGDVEVMELDVTVPEHFDNVVGALDSKWGGVDGVLHAIGFAPASCLGGDFFGAPWSDVATAVQISTYSYSALAKAMIPLWKNAGGGTLVGLTFDATVAWPAYDWMGIAKAGLESANRYLARELGAINVRTNLVAAGPIRSLAAENIPGFAKFEDVWQERSPLGWNISDSSPVGKACAALMSDWFPATTGEIIHVDGGFHAVGA